MTELSEEISIQRKYHNVTGKFIDACDNCQKQLSVYTGVRIKGGDFKDERFNYTKDLCIACAEEDCALWKKTKYLNIPQSIKNENQERCDRSIRKVESLLKSRKT